MWYRYSKFKYKPVLPVALGLKGKTSKETKTFADEMVEDIEDKTEKAPDELESLDSGMSDLPGFLPETVNKPDSPSEVSEPVLVDLNEPPVQSNNVQPINQPVFNPLHDRCKCGQRIKQMISGKKIWSRNDSMCPACKAAADAFDAEQDRLYPDPPIQI